LDFLLNIDISVFYFINHTLSNPLFDKFFPFITDPKNWFIAYTILYLTLIIKGGKRGRIAAVVLILLVAASDQLSSNLLKNLFERIRPCNALPDVRILVGCTGSYSFPSSHAVNNFSVAVFFSRLYPKYKITFIIAASLVALSRPYVGVHYPSDILGGALIGSAVGYIFSRIALGIEEKINKRFVRIK
jgi:undecaprenyl-diphosphatase